MQNMMVESCTEAFKREHRENLVAIWINRNLEENMEEQIDRCSIAKHKKYQILQPIRTNRPYKVEISGEEIYNNQIRL